MIVGTGIDIVSVSRIEETITRQGQTFLDRVFTPAEQAYCQDKKNPYESYAARFAAKEAAMKALGTGWGQGVAWVDVEIQKDKDGPPRLSLSGKALEKAQALGASNFFVSLSHDAGLCVAQVVLEGAGE